MVQFYVLQIKLGRLQLENVPERWRAEVESALTREVET
ncbi:CD1375 family protein [Candidatus Allofournierella merdipullorum]|nr:CD1375 family protein [Candidatus Fournierella merdipullorum]